jgi:RNA polymerase sigma-70 factor (ECF subfamily)
VGQRQSDFEALVAPHAAGLLRFARRLCGGTAEAEDVVQETLLKAWRGIDGLRQDSNPRAWLFRILLNTWHSAGRRKAARLIEMPLRDAAGITRDILADAAELNQALSRLPEQQRTVLLLAVVEGFTCREIATMLEVPVGTVMSRLSRARATMREFVPRRDNSALTAREKLEQV